MALLEGACMASHQAVERWLPVPGYAGFYEVSDFGRVRSVSRLVPVGSALQLRVGRALRLSRSNSGYFCAGLWRDGKVSNVFVHRLVLMAFEPRDDADTLQGNHLDGDKSNNSRSNLEWATPSGNRLHSVRVLGNAPPRTAGGPDHKWARAVERIGADGVKRYPQMRAAIADGFNVSCITECCRGTQKTHRGFQWRYVQGDAR